MRRNIWEVLGACIRSKLFEDKKRKWEKRKDFFKHV